MSAAVDTIELPAGIGMRTAFRATTDGLLVEATAEHDRHGEIETAAADAAGVMKAANLLSMDLAGTRVHAIQFELQNGERLTLSPAADDSIAVLHSGPDTTAEQPRAPLHPLPATPAASPGSAGALAEEPRSGSAVRLMLRNINLMRTGHVLTATVTLTFGDQQVHVKTVTPDAPERRAAIIAETTARAIMEFFPSGYGIEVAAVRPTSADREGLWVLCRFLTPEGEHSSFGIAPIEANDWSAAARAVLNAFNRRAGLLLKTKTSPAQGGR